MKIREVIAEAPVVKKPVQPVQAVDPAQQKQAAIEQPPTNPAGNAAFKTGQVTAKGVQGAKNVAQAVGQAVATGAEKTANVVAKGAQATHDVATKAAGAIDQGTSAVQGLRKSVAGIGQFGTSGFMSKDQQRSTARGSSDVEDALSDIQPDELKQMLMAIANGKDLTPGQKNKLSNAANKL
jgi:uncharacterized protein YoxC